MTRVPAAAYVVFISVIAVLGIGVAAGYAYQDSAEKDLCVTGERLTVNYTQPSTVENADALRLYDNETVRNESGYVLEEPNDYGYNTSSGEIQWDNTTNTTSGENATIDYCYANKTEGVLLLKGVTDGGLTLAAFLPALAIVVGVIGSLLWFVSRIGSSGMSGGVGR